ncbi:MAG: TlpA family protein disulfide reductase [Chloroflexi bacterium]|nr:TlpA family protein disulfide reductase [Chloroflexota bacterium]
MNVKLSSMIGVLALGLGAYLYNTVPVSQAAGSDTKPENRAVAAPAWVLKDLNDKTVKSSDLKGKVVILDFWATWCGPCRMEIPGFIELQKNYGAKGLVVVGIALDEEGTTVVKPFATKAGINYTVLIGDAKVQRAFGDVNALPTTFVIDREGRIVSRHVGYADTKTFEHEIKRLLSP